MTTRTIDPSTDIYTAHDWEVIMAEKVTGARLRCKNPERKSSVVAPDKGHETITRSGTLDEVLAARATAGYFCTGKSASGDKYLGPDVTLPNDRALEVKGTEYENGSLLFGIDPKTGRLLRADEVRGDFIMLLVPGHEGLVLGNPLCRRIAGVISKERAVEINRTQKLRSFARGPQEWVHQDDLTCWQIFAEWLVDEVEEQQTKRRTG